MKKTISGFLAGFLVATVVFFGGAEILSAAGLSNVTFANIKIVVDGREIKARDVNGNAVNPLHYNGTTYLPIRALAEAINMPVYWDGDTKTVYAGDMSGELPNPTVKLEDAESKDLSVTTSPYVMSAEGDIYALAVDGFKKYEFNLGKKYSKLKGSIIVPQKQDVKGSSTLTIIADSKIIYTSPEMKKDSIRADFDIKVDDVKTLNFVWNTTATNGEKIDLKLVNAGFYQ